MRFLILGRDIPLENSDKVSIEHSEIVCKEPLDNSYEENCNNSLSSEELNKENTKPKTRGPVV